MTVVKFLKELDCFKELHSQFLLSDWKELVSALSYKEVQPGTKLYNMDSEVSNFYYILSGSVNLKHKNHNIKDWDWAMQMN